MDFVLDPSTLEDPADGPPTGGEPAGPRLAEQDELSILLDEGLTFQTPVRSPLRWLGQRERTWLLKQPYLGTSDYLAREWAQLDFDLDALKAHGDDEMRRLVAHHARRAARIVAIALLNSRWGIRLLTGVFSQYLLWRLTPGKLLQLVRLINQQANLPAFTLSIRLMSLTPRTSQPTRIETEAGGRQPD